MPRKYHEGDEPVPGSGYRLTDFLGRGGFGEVWKASAPGGTEAALKIIQLGGTEGRKEFRALQLVKRIRHTHLVPIYSFWLKNAEGQVIDDSLIDTAETIAGETKPAELRATMAPPPVLIRSPATELIIAMGLGDKSLFDRLHECIAEGRNGIPLEELLHYLEDAAEAIDFLNRQVHNLGSGPAAIQHCDIKPHNLMIVGGGAQVCDFGLARMMGADRTTTAAATLAYAAPECLVEGKPSASTDQYSLAVSYYELKTGLLPYKDETLAAVMDAKRQGKLDFSKVSSAEQAVLRRATSQNPLERYPSSLEMIKSLERAANQTSSTETATFPRKQKKKSKLPMRFVAALLLLGVIAGGYILATRSNFSKKQDGGPIALPLKKGDPEISQSKNSGQLAENPSDPSKRVADPDKRIAEKDNPNPPLPPSVSDLVKEAKSLIALGQWQAVMEKCNAAMLIDAKSVDAYFLRGQCYSNLEPVDYDKAIADFEKAKSLSTDDRFRSSPEFAVAFLGRGTALLAAKNFDGAIADLTEAGKYNLGDYRIFSRLGAAELSKGRWQNAVDAFNISIKINPDEGTDFFNRGRAYRKLDRTVEAIKDFLRAAAINPQNAEVQLYLGNAYIDREKPDEAAAAFGKAIEILDKPGQSPKEMTMLAQALFSRGSAYLGMIESQQANKRERSDNYRKAVENFTRAAHLFDPTDIDLMAQVHNLRFLCYEALDEKEKAEQEKKVGEELKMLAKNPGDADAMNNIAYYLSTSSDSDILDAPRAIVFATHACEISKWENPHFIDTLARAFAENGQFEDAAKREAEAIKLISDDTEADEYRTRLEQYKKGRK